MLSSLLNPLSAKKSQKTKVKVNLCASPSGFVVPYNLFNLTTCVVSLSDIMQERVFMWSTYSISGT